MIGFVNNQIRLIELLNNGVLLQKLCCIMFPIGIAKKALPAV